MNTQIRTALRHEMVAKGWSQQQLAEAAGVRQATVSRLLTGERQGEPATWEHLLTSLELEIVAVPKGTNMSKLLAESGA